MSELVEEVLAGIYRIDVPLPRSPLKALNSYVVKSSDRCLVVDTGMNREECIGAMRRGLERLAVDPSRTDFFITHLHADHVGCVSELAADSSAVYMSEVDARWLNAPGYWERVREYARANGFPEGELEEAISKHPGYRYSVRGRPRFSFVRGGDEIRVGGYTFRCIETPGHTRGHMCLYEPVRKVLISGDHILGDITPNISRWADDVDALGDYLTSLDKVYDMDVGLVLPGHRNIITDSKRRISELKRHHARRLGEVVSILRRGSQTAYEVASQMEWDIACDSWESFPIPQKWFATGEALAHLRYLERRGAVEKQVYEGVTCFQLR